MKTKTITVEWASPSTESANVFSDRFELIVEGVSPADHARRYRIVLKIYWHSLPCFARALWRAFKRRRETIQAELVFHEKALRNEWE